MRWREGGREGEREGEGERGGESARERATSFDKYSLGYALMYRCVYTTCVVCEYVDVYIYMNIRICVQNFTLLYAQVYLRVHKMDCV